MKKRYILYIVIAVVFISILSVNTFDDYETVNTYQKPSKFNSEEKPQQKITPKSVESDRQYSYIVKYNNGHLYVYNGDKQIVDTFSVNFNSMREYDKKLLEQGISVNSIEEVYHIAEDFSE